MCFTPILTALSLLATFTVAQEKRDVSPEQSTSAAVALKSYIDSLPTNSGFLAAVSSIETDSAAYSELSRYLPSVASAIADGTIPSNYLSAVPTGQVASLIESVASEANSVLTMYGFSNILPSATGGITVQATSTGTTSPTSTASSKTSKAGAAETHVGYVAAFGLGLWGAVVGNNLM